MDGFWKVDKWIWQGRQGMKKTIHLERLAIDLEKKSRDLEKKSIDLKSQPIGFERISIQLGRKAID